MTTRKSSGERRTEIADAAIKIIGERGLREFTAAQVAQEVGIKDGTVFRHFKDMNAIAEAALDRLQALVGMSPPPTADPLEGLKEFVLSRLRSVTAQPALQALLFSDQLSHALGAEGPPRVAALRNRGRAFVRSCLHEAAEQRLLREDLDLEAAVVLVTGMVMGFVFAAKDGAWVAPIGEMEQRCWETLRSMLERTRAES
ncbi:MAG: TetR/AcrR family transcriptional regulator [Proteobacteria bacterium]|nr:TetR/AcrR family transcriptional regulator [Pseudomonadota bacterium]